MAETGIKKDLAGRLGAEEANVSGTSIRGQQGYRHIGVLERQKVHESEGCS